MLLGAPAVNAATGPRLRFLNAVPGTATARVEVVSTTTGVRTGAGGESGYGEFTPYAAVPTGAVRVELVAPKLHAATPAELAAGASYTVIATGSGGNARLHVYPDARPAAGTAKLRVIHAAPELGTPDISLGGRPIAQAVAFGSSTPYLTVTPGSQTLTVVSPHGNRTLASGQVTLAAGTATTAVVIGTAGEPVRVASGEDATVTPGGPPETGLGGLASGGGRPWILILAAMTAGGALAGGLQAAARRRREH